MNFCFHFNQTPADVYEDVVGHTLRIFDEHCHHLDRHQLVANCFDTFHFANKKKTEKCDIGDSTTYKK